MLTQKCFIAVRRRMATLTGDDGFSMVEMIVAFSVLVVFAIALGITLTDGLSVSKASRERVAAANLAAREIEIVRNQFGSSTTAALAVAATGDVTNPNALSGGASVVDGVSYTVRRNVQWLPIGNGASACDGGSLVNYPSLRVTVQVSWPRMGTSKPVMSRTVLTPPKGTLDDQTLSFLAVKVQNATGGRSSGVAVTASGPGGTFNETTDASGCAVFQVGAAGTYTVEADMPGWVDQSGVQHSTATSTVSAGGLQRLDMTYDRAATLLVQATNDQYPTYQMPTTLASVSYVQPNVPVANSVRTVVMSGATATVGGLWPTPDGYSPWAGGCNDADPAATMGGARIAPVVVPAGGTRSAVVKLAPLSVTVQDYSGVATAGVQVTATSLNCAATVPDRVLVLGTSGANGVLQSSLPYGRWRLDAVVNGRAGTVNPLAMAGTGITSTTLKAS